MVKKTISIGILLCLGFIITGGRILSEWPDTYFHFITCDVGQGDALLLTYGFTQVLIDAGKNETVLSCLDNYIPFWDRTLEMIVITHPDFDHYGGIRAVLERYEVKTLTQLPLRKIDAEFEALQRVIQAKEKSGTRVMSIFAAEYILLDTELQIQILWPNKKTIEKLPVEALLAETLLSDERVEKTETTIDGNPLSITLLATYKGISFLLTGDLEKESELALAKSPLMMRAQVLKVGHHGSKTSSSIPFLEKVAPEIAVISAGKNNQYNHPDEGVINSLEKFVGEHIYRTDTQGTVHLFTDGYLIWKK